MSKLKDVVETKLSLDAKFKFRCHKDIKCFTKCCSNVDILLTPYDVLRLKKRLKLTSDEFLEKYTYMNVDNQSSHPYAMLMMNNDEKRECPFLTKEGCDVYTDRPANCRYYPVGQGTLKVEDKDGNPENEEFYFLVTEDHCLGYKEDREWTVASWREDQGVDEYDEVNKEWKAIQLRRNLPGQEELSEKKQFQFYMASYDHDRFRRFIFNSKFLDVFDIDDETIAKIKDDDIALIKFGVKYIKYVMMLEQSLKVKEEHLKEKSEKEEENK